MHRFTFRLAVALLTFILGVTAASVWFLTQNKASKSEQVKQNELEAMDGKLQIVSDAFKGIDYKSHSYPYQFSYGKRINITLKDGKYEYDIDNDRGWFNFSDVYYVDITGDGNPEAIVMLWHVSCGASCDGGAALLYVYATRRNGMELLWEYETGSMAYGCGLKSFTVKDRKITMELFGRCFDKIEESLGISKFLVKDTTRLTFGYNGSKIAEEKKEIISAPERNVMNYEQEISINE